MSSNHRGRAVYPGSFDPATNGHVDIIRRALKIFDHLTVAVLENVAKETLFTPEERVALLQSSLAGMQRVEVVKFSGLLVDLVDAADASVIVRGLRFVSDFEYELQMALMNESLKPGVETVFLVAAPEQAHVSSSIVKGVARQGRDVASYVPAPVARALKEKYR